MASRAGAHATFAERVREELAHQEVVSVPLLRAEVAACLRVGGAWSPARGPAWVMESSSGALVRRVRTSLAGLADEPVDVAVRRASGGRRTRYRVRVVGQESLAAIGLVDRAGRPVRGLGRLPTSGQARAAVARGLLLGAGSISDPARAVHLEVRAPSAAVARDVVTVLGACGAPTARAAPHGDAWRVAVKSGTGIATLLARVGAHGSYLDFDERRMRRELRRAANRAANADRANVGRAVAASGRQIAAIEALVAARGWEELDADVRAVALARLANPEASLAELGELLEPPLGKVAVHRMMARIETAARDLDDG